jgi:hypothetical protein
MLNLKKIQKKTKKSKKGKQAMVEIDPKILQSQMDQRYLTIQEKRPMTEDRSRKSALTQIFKSYKSMNVVSSTVPRLTVKPDPNEKPLWKFEPSSLTSILFSNSLNDQSGSEVNPNFSVSVDQFIPSLERDSNIKSLSLSKTGYTFSMISEISSQIESSPQNLRVYQAVGLFVHGRKVPLAQISSQFPYQKFPHPMIRRLHQQKPFTNDKLLFDFILALFQSGLVGSFLYYFPQILHFYKIVIILMLLLGSLNFSTKLMHFFHFKLTKLLLILFIL